MENLIPQNLERLIETLPDSDGARRFVRELSERHPSDVSRLLRNEGLSSDVLTLAAFSPLLSTTLLQNPDYIWWLERRRAGKKIRSKEELLESLARFALTNTDAEPQVLLSRFRRRELLRIFLLDVRRLSTIAETTEEISNLADAILEHALTRSLQEMDNRYGAPMVSDGKNRLTRAGFCVVSFGKLGSKELNYSSDIDLLFIYSDEGNTAGQGSRGSVTNREYFVKLSEHLIKMVGGQSGEGAAYRVDLRLRPHGRVGALALSVDDTAAYYNGEAHDWERQVLIRSRASAGDPALFERFFSAVSESVFSTKQSVEDALLSVRRSKDKIDREHRHAKGFNVKLGHGGIREIEFIAQALQLAHGGHDRWLRAPHTLISLARLADRGHVSDVELNQLFEAYDFLREAEHVLQMEHGLQTHIIPEETEKRDLFARRMGFRRSGNFDSALALHTSNVSRVFHRIFGESAASEPIDSSIEEAESKSVPAAHDAPSSPLVKKVLLSVEKHDESPEVTREGLATLEVLARLAPHFAEMVSANPGLASQLPGPDSGFIERDFLSILSAVTESESSFQRRLAEVRRRWAALLLEIAVLDVRGTITTQTAKRQQTRLAEASIDACLTIAAEELGAKLGEKLPDLPVAVLGLGKLGGRGVDYGSDLDIVVVYDDESPVPVADITHTEFYSRLVEIFTTVIAGMTREGQLYRTDLRLRPNGKSGPAAVGKKTILRYFEEDAAVWEWLAYVKLRASGGDRKLGEEVEHTIRETIQRRASATPAEDLASETKRIRARLESERTASLNSREIDIKFGPGGLLDVYFATRYLQILHGVAEDEADRSTKFTLEKLSQAGIVSGQDFEDLMDGYRLLSSVDHTVRLAVGRSTRVSFSNHEATRAMCRMLNLDSVEELSRLLSETRAKVRSAFDRILG